MPNLVCKLYEEALEMKGLVTQENIGKDINRTFTELKTNGQWIREWIKIYDIFRQWNTTKLNQLHMST